MTQLAELRSELRSLGARRRRTRVVDVLLVGAALLVAALVLYYFADRVWNLNVASRGFVDLLLLAGLGWAAVKYLLPVMQRREDEIDAALRFERGRGIDSDLVAALQFDAASDDPQAMRYFGSARLTEAVIDETSRSAGSWNLREEPLDGAPPRRRYGLIALVLLGLVAFVAYPRHAVVFAQRVLLASPHYPSNTQIDRLTVNGHSAIVDSKQGSSSNSAAPQEATIFVPLGRAIAVELQASGTLPEQVRVELTGASGGGMVLELLPVAGRSDLFQATLPAPVESLVGRATAGDAYTEKFHLTAVPLPAATVTLEVRPPAYAAEAALEPPPPGRLYASVLEGSDVAIRVEGANKSLKQVELHCGEETYQLQAADAERRTWRLDPAGTKFAAISQPLEFSINVVDDDGFALLEPLRGSLAMRADQPPSIAADVVTKFVLPVGKPTIIYQAADDLGVQSIAVERQVLRLDGTIQTDLVPIPLPTDAVLTGFTGRFPLELAPLQLRKGEKVTIRLQARDRRADDAARAVSQSEPFVLEVTDEPGLYEAMAETDQRSALKMDEIIQKQLLMTGKAGSQTQPGPRPTSTPTAAPTTPSATPSTTGSGAKP